MSEFTNAEVEAASDVLAVGCVCDRCTPTQPKGGALRDPSAFPFLEAETGLRFSLDEMNQIPNAQKETRRIYYTRTRLAWEIREFISRDLLSGTVKPDEASAMRSGANAIYAKEMELARAHAKLNAELTAPQQGEPSDLRG